MGVNEVELDDGSDEGVCLDANDGVEDEVKDEDDAVEYGVDEG